MWRKQCISMFIPSSPSGTELNSTESTTTLASSTTSLLAGSSDSNPIPPTFALNYPPSPERTPSFTTSNSSTDPSSSSRVAATQLQEQPLTAFQLAIEIELNASHLKASLLQLQDASYRQKLFRTLSLLPPEPPSIGCTECGNIDCESIYYKDPSVRLCCLCRNRLLICEECSLLH